MRTLKTLKPGQKGTKALLARFGTNLLCVRYRYDEATGQRVKTVELIIQRRRPPDTHTPSPVARRGVRTQRPRPHPSTFAQGGSPHRLARNRPAPAGQVRRRLVGPGEARLDPAPRPGRASRPAAPGGGEGRLGMETWRLHEETWGEGR